MASVSQQALCAGYGAVVSGATVVKTASTLSNSIGGVHSENLGIGTAAANRYVIVVIAIACPTATTFLAVEVDGQPTTKVVDLDHDSGQRRTAIFITNSPVTSGTSQIIACALSGDSTEASFQVYKATGLNSTTPTATATDAASAWSQSLAVSAGGFIVAGFHINSNATHTWAGSGITEDYDYIGAGGSNAYSSASGNYAAGATPTVSVTPSSGSIGGLAMAAFR